MCPVNWYALASQLGAMGLGNAAQDALRYGAREEEQDRRAREQAARAASTEERARRLLAEAYELIDGHGDAFRAVELAQQARTLAPREHLAAFLLGFASRRAADEAGAGDARRAQLLSIAVEAFGAATTLNPKDAESFSRLAEAQLASGSIDDGFQNVRRALLLDAGNELALGMARMIVTIIQNVK